VEEKQQGENEMQKPSIHLNGTHPKDLLHDYYIAHDMLRDAINYLSNTRPHGRDYYPQGENALYLAQEEHKIRMEKLQDVLAEVNELVTYCSSEVSKREARRVNY
jgi:hypothetical protein